MTHVVLRNHPDSPDYPWAFQLLVDGQDMSQAVLAGSVTITTPTTTSFDDFARVTMTVAADTLEVDLPACVVDALRQGGGE